MNDCVEKLQRKNYKERITKKELQRKNRKAENRKAENRKAENRNADNREAVIIKHKSIERLYHVYRQIRQKTYLHRLQNQERF